MQEIIRSFRIQCNHRNPWMHLWFSASKCSSAYTTSGHLVVVWEARLMTANGKSILGRHKASWWFMAVRRKKVWEIPPLKRDLRENSNSLCDVRFKQSRNGRSVHKSCCLCFHLYDYIPITRTLFWETINESPDVRAHFPLREMKWRAACRVSCVRLPSLTDICIRVHQDVIKLY